MIKRWLSILTVVIGVAVMLSACGGSSGDSTSTSGTASGSGPSSGDQKTVGVAVLASVSLIEENAEAFKKELEKSGANVKFEEFNAQGQLSNVNSIAIRLAQLHPDLTYLVGTPLVEAFAKDSPESPYIFGAMTDPVGAGVAKSLEQPGGDGTGTSDRVPANITFEAIKEVVPGLKSVGVIGNTAEENTVVQFEELEEQASKEGIEVQKRTVTNTGEVASAIRSLEGVEALVIPADNTVGSALGTVAQTSQQLGIPAFGLLGATAAEEGLLVGLGADYAQLGTKAGEQAAEILEGASPGDIPVVLGAEEHAQIGVNLQTAEALGLQIPATLEKEATVVVK